MCVRARAHSVVSDSVCVCVCVCVCAHSVVSDSMQPPGGFFTNAPPGKPHTIGIQ